MRNGFFKGEALGNDYLVVDPGDLDFRLTPENVRVLCDRHRGIGSDGILVLAESSRADFGLRILNPNGSEAEKSGNGLRIFGRFLHATRRTRRTVFTVETPGGVVTVELSTDRHGDASGATVQMGTASFLPKSLPCRLDVPELVDQPIEAGGEPLLFTGVSVGNPHCVVFRDQPWSVADLHRLGPVLSAHALFPKQTNLQLAHVKGASSLEIRIWERGAGETLASGSSACAAAAAAVRRGLIRSPVAVVSPGGKLTVTVSDAFELALEGPVQEVVRGRLSRSFLRKLR